MTDGLVMDMANLMAMRFGAFEFPVNPAELKVAHRALLRESVAPGGAEQVQRVGAYKKRVSGKGYFTGETAMADYLRLEALFGTVQTLFAHGGGITKFLVQSVATRPDQVQHINEFIAREVAQFPDRLYGFGALHPDSPTLEEDIAHLRALGLHGVKLHPDIQGFRLDDPRCFALAEQCEGVLPLLLHTGDSRYDFSNPNRLIPLLRRFPRLTVIGAHFGGYTIWQEAARQLAGRFENLWVDCSSSFFAMDVAAGRALIDAYGADRVLFGTDYPMWDPQHELARLRGMHLAPETERKILYDNAAALFGLEGEN